MLDEYWYYSLFTLFMLVAFECTTCFQRLKTLGEFRTMSVQPFDLSVQRQHGGPWQTRSSRELLPGDRIRLPEATAAAVSLPADCLLLSGSAIVNEAMLSGESTPLLKESIRQRPSDQLFSFHADPSDSQDAKLHVLYSGTKILQTRPEPQSQPESQSAKTAAVEPSSITAYVLRTGFATQQGQLVRTMLFASDPVTANNTESFLFIAFLLVFAIAASAYVWTQGLERGLAKKKLLLDCILIITSVVPPELPMELSLSVNASLAALGRYAIFCTEPFRIPQAGRVDVCCFDKTGTITAENLVVQGVVTQTAAFKGIDDGLHSELSQTDSPLQPLTETLPLTMLTLAAAHSLVLLDNGTVVGDPMEKTTLESLRWRIEKGLSVWISLMASGLTDAGWLLHSNR